MSDRDGIESRVTPYNQHTKVMVTDRPDPNCLHCGGRGTVGGCGREGCDHVHTYSFCRCVNERQVAVEVISDGFGNEWYQCEICHNLEVVRPGRAQCDCESGDE